MTSHGVLDYTEVHTNVIVSLATKLVYMYVLHRTHTSCIPIICLIPKRARVTLLLTQCIIIIDVLHILLSVLLLLRIKISHYSWRFYLQMTLQHFIYELTIVISNGKKKSVY